MPTIHIEVPDEEQYERIKHVKEELDLTWRGMLMHAVIDLEGTDGIRPPDQEGG